MAVHDWTRVAAGLFHDFHHEWISEIKRALNRGLLPNDYYALTEQVAAGFGPDVLTIQGSSDNGASPSSASNDAALVLAPPKVKLTAEIDNEEDILKQDSLSIRHITKDRVVAMVEIVSPGNKASQYPLFSFIEKTKAFLRQGIHLLILDVHPPGPRDPYGLHALIWQEMADESYELPKEHLLTLASYEAHQRIRAFVDHLAIGEVLPSMPLFLEPGAHIELPLESTYQSAFAEVPRRWRTILDAPSS